jgi:hypothetical protein
MMRTVLPEYKALPAVSPAGGFGPAVIFGADNTPKKQEAKPEEQNLKTPKPGYGWHNLKRFGLMATGIFTAFGLPSVHSQFKQWSKQSAEENSIAQIHQTARQNHLIRWADDTYLPILMLIEGLLLAGAARKNSLKKAIRPRDLWANLNSKGIQAKDLTGKNLKVAVIDTGYVPTVRLKPENVTYFDASTQKPIPTPKDSSGHGTSVASIIADAAPNAQFVMIRHSGQAQDKEMSKRIKAFFEEGFHLPSQMNLNELRRLHRPSIESIAQGVRLGVDQGAHVINVSLSVEQAVQMGILYERIMTMASLWLEKTFASTNKLNSKEFSEKQEQYAAYQKQLAVLSKANELSEKIDETLKDLYKPWLEALDYAQQKGVAVVLASGNSGGHKAPKGDLIGNINLLAAFPHPALLVVASSNEAGQISQFTSEMNDEVRPLIAANGSGELLTQNGAKNTLFDWIFSPLSGLRKRLDGEMPQGTSFAAPDLTLTYLKMKAVYPGLTPQEASEIFQKTATPAEFDKKHAKAIQEKAKSKLTEAFVEAHLKNVMSHPRFLSFLAACVLYYSGSEVKAKDLLSSIELKQQQNTLQFTYHKRLTPEEREIITRSIATTLHEFKALSIPVEVSDEALAKEVETQLKRRVGAGRVNRLAALLEAQTRANSKSGPEKSA